MVDSVGLGTGNRFGLAFLLREHEVRLLDILLGVVFGRVVLELGEAGEADVGWAWS